MTNPDGSLWKPPTMLPLWWVSLRGFPRVGVYVAAKTRGQAVACAYRKGGGQDMGYRFTDLRARQAEDPELGGQIEWAAEEPTLLADAHGVAVDEGAMLALMDADLRRALYGRG